MMCPSERRKVRANVLRARRSSPTPASEPEVVAFVHLTESKKTYPPENEDVEDKRVARKLRNRASALASRNKRTEEIETLTYRLGKLMSGEFKDELEYFSRLLSPLHRRTHDERSTKAAIQVVEI